MNSNAKKPLERALVWLRRDLRCEDHAALHHACKTAEQVWCAFVFDRDILDPLPRVDRRVEFIRDSLEQVHVQLAAWGTAHGHADVGLIVRHAAAVSDIPKLAAQLGVQAVYASHDDDPAALARDAAVRTALANEGRAYHSFKDHVIFERSEVLTLASRPYSVFTPYKNSWLKKLHADHLRPLEVEAHAASLATVPAGMRAGVPSLESLGFQRTNLHDLNIPVGQNGGQTLLADFLDRIDNYEDTRNFPAVKGPSYLSVHLRFGTVSIRQLAQLAFARAEKVSHGGATWLSELIWRDFYHQILHHYPRVVTSAFKSEYEAIQWEQGDHAKALFVAWCEGRTGYPLVDAAMAQINQTGYMHNRLRMVVASFLVKDLGLDWRWGEAYFALHLNDYELASNNGGWQWAASTGCDAQPYFRIFNPTAQSEKFDAQGKFIRRYVPQLAALPDAALHAPWAAKPAELAAAGVVIGKDYPAPMVKHDEARAVTLKRYAVVKTKA